jgi:hypothetical protein
VALAGAGVPEEYDGFVVGHEAAVAQQGDRGRGDVVVGGQVELVEGLDPWQLRFVDSSGSASFVADIELDAQGFSEERRMGDPSPGGVAEQGVELGGEPGERQLPAGVDRSRGVGDRGCFGHGVGSSWLGSMVRSWS